MKNKIRFATRKIIEILIDACPEKLLKIVEIEIENIKTETHIREQYLRLANKMMFRLLLSSGLNGEFIGKTKDTGLFTRYNRDAEWSKKIVDMIIENINSDDRRSLYIDIGANIGLTTIPVAKKTNNTRCIAFEPENENYKLLRANLIINDVEEKVQTVNKAVADIEQISQLELSPNNHGDHRLRLKTAKSLMGENQWEMQKISTVRLDDIQICNNEKLIIKIDVQGAEPLVFKGGLNTINKAELIFFEFSPYQISRMNLSPEILFQYIEPELLVEIVRGDSGEEPLQLTGSNAAVLLRTLYDIYKNTPNNAYWDVSIERAAITNQVQHRVH